MELRRSLRPTRDLIPPGSRGPLRRGPFRVALLLLIPLVLIVAVCLHGLIVTIHPYHYSAQNFDIAEVGDQHNGCEVVDDLGRGVGRVFATNREPVALAEVPQHFIEAVIATEDARFFRHGGTDVQGGLRAAVTNLRASRVAQGGSTITMQLAREVYRLKERTLQRKLTELFLARRIERHYDKREILEQYFNRIYFGSGCWGIGAAARDFFGKPVTDLSLEESALLAGIIKRPSGFSPYLSPEAATAARNRTFERMTKQGFLQEEDARYFQRQPLEVLPRSERVKPTAYVLDQLEHEARLILRQRGLPLEGYVIHTSADLELQARVEDLVQESLTRLEADPAFPYPPTGKQRIDCLQAAVVILHNPTGRIVASLGGRDYHLSQFNRVVQARRPAGSAFVPFVYAAAFDLGEVTPRTAILDIPMDNRKVMIGGDSGVLGEWSSERFDTIYEGEITAAYSLLHSKNAATVRIGNRVGLDRLTRFAARAGFESGFRPFPATFLGASEVSLLELARAYTLFPNDGREPPEASLIDHITQPNGKIVYARPRPRDTRVISPESSRQITRILQASLYDPDGPNLQSSRGLCSRGHAGKSGTVYGFTDAWFAGYDKDYTCAVWVGFDQPKRLAGNGFGHEIALPIWTAVMNELGSEAPLPSPELFDREGPLFCEFDRSGTEENLSGCNCVLHQSSYETTKWAAARRNPPSAPAAPEKLRPVKAHKPVLAGRDPYSAAWPQAR